MRSIEADLTPEDLTILCEYMLARSVLWHDGPLATPCRVWLGGVNNSGYGSIRLKGKWAVHRIGYLLGHGAPARQQANHRCHQSRYWAPGHLYNGSQAQNVADAIAAGRMQPPRNRGARRTAQVLRIGRGRQPMEQAFG
jgi:hypothetical protein